MGELSIPDVGAMNSSYVSRDEWGALPPVGRRRMQFPIPNVIITYDFEAEKCETKEACIPVLQDLQRKYIRELEEDDIPFNFLIGGDGTVYEGRGWHAQPSNSLSNEEFNDKRLDIAYIGKYLDGDRMELSRPAQDLAQYGVVLQYVFKDYSMVELPDLEMYSFLQPKRRIKSKISKRSKSSKRSKKSK